MEGKISFTPLKTTVQKDILLKNSCLLFGYNKLNTVDLDEKKACDDLQHCSTLISSVQNSFLPPVGTCSHLIIYTVNNRSPIVPTKEQAKLSVYNLFPSDGLIIFTIHH